jgi:ABC-type lipoprotein export system ATPase subunit
MTNLPNQRLWEQYASDYLICQAEYPLISSASLKEEVMLYNLDAADQKKLISEFILISGKELTSHSDLTVLSGGQKVILMVLLALLSPAQKILFENVLTPLDGTTGTAVQKLIEKYRQEKQEILLID